MKHALQPLSLGDHLIVELTPDRYEQLKTAREALARGLAIEEHYEIVVASYFDFETEILSQSSRDAASQPRL